MCVRRFDFDVESLLAGVQKGYLPTSIAESECYLCQQYRGPNEAPRLLTLSAEYAGLLAHCDGNRTIAELSEDKNGECEAEVAMVRMLFENGLVGLQFLAP